ncbi:MAG: spherulation-specific family 4 protein [Desulfurobacteriaceae bacterium]
MRKIILIFVLSFFVSCGGEEYSELSAKPKIKGSILPVYSYNFTVWDQIISFPDGSKKFFIVINPFNGPGVVVDYQYSEFVSAINENGKIPLGYVYSSWGTRDMQEVEDDIDLWLKLYPEIKGFFIDEVEGINETFYYYKKITDYIRSLGNFSIVLNVGALPDEAYFDIADLVVIFENSLDKVEDLQVSSFRDKSACLVYQVPYEDWFETFEMVSEFCSYVFLTDDSSPTPYDSLPSYFWEEMEEIENN